MPNALSGIVEGEMDHHKNGELHISNSIAHYSKENSKGEKEESLSIFMLFELNVVSFFFFLFKKRKKKLFLCGWRHS